MDIFIAKTEKELEEAYRIRKIVFVDEQHVPMEEEVDDFEKEAIHFIGYHEDEVVAASRLRFVDELGKLERICVLKPYRGKSYGKKIIERMEAEIAKRGYSKAKLHAQTHAKEFYERLGYKVVSEQFFDAGILHVAMAKTLKNQ